MSNTTKVVLVTGVSLGIGRATVEMFVERGSKVFSTVRNIGKAKPIPSVKLVETDICDEASIQRGIEFIIAKASMFLSTVQESCYSVLRKKLM